MGAPARARLLAGALLAALTSACTPLIAHRIAEPPRFEAPRRGPFAHPLEKAGVALETFARPDAPRIAYAVVPPGDYGFTYEFRADPGLWSYRLDYHAAKGPALPARGTVVLLHGWSTSMLANLHWALALAQRGYRCVLVDLRNHGASGSAPAGFGLREADDVRALIAALRDAHRIEGPLSVLGVSMGAVAALRVAAADREVRAVVAIEPFANAADAIPAATGGLLSLPTVEPGLKRVLTPKRMAAVVARLEAELALDLHALDTARVVAEVPACTAIVHGQRDTLIPVHATRALGAGQANVQRVELAYDGHFSTPARLDLLLDPVADWLERAARARDGCPPLRVYGLPPVEGYRAVVR